MLEPLRPHQGALEGVVVASPSHWYGLVAGCMEAGSRGHLAHPAAMQPYRGLP
jgi:hypothetical protein